MADSKLVGQDYPTSDLVAKVTGQAKYAEDFRADGMLFVKLLLSRMPHARVTRIDASAALAMPGVKAILTADELPKPTGGTTDLGKTVEADPHNERALTNEPMYQGEPILAVAAVDELTAAEAIERIQVDMEPLPFVDRSAGESEAGRTERPHRRQRLGAASRGTSRRPLPTLVVGEVKWTEADFAAAQPRPAADGQARRRMVVRRSSMPGSRTRRWCSTKRSSRPTPAIRRSSRGARWPTGRTASCSCTAPPRAPCRPSRPWPSGSAPTRRNVVIISEYTGGGFGSKITSDVCASIPGAAVEEDEHAGADADFARRRALPGRRAPGVSRPGEGWLRQGRPPHCARSLRHLRQRPVRIAG